MIKTAIKLYILLLADNFKMACTPSTKDAMCAGAAAYLMKAGRPTIGMRIGYLTGAVAPSEWDKAADMVILPLIKQQQRARIRNQNEKGLEGCCTH